MGKAEYKGRHAYAKAINYSSNNECREMKATNISGSSAILCAKRRVQCGELVLEHKDKIKMCLRSSKSRMFSPTWAVPIRSPEMPWIQASRSSTSNKLGSRPLRLAVMDKLPGGSSLKLETPSLYQNQAFVPGRGSTGPRVL